MFLNSSQTREEKKDQVAKCLLVTEIASRNDMKISFNRDANTWICKGEDGFYIGADSISNLIDKMWQNNIR